MSSTLASAPVRLNAATSANVIALAYVSDGAESFIFQGPGTIIEDIQQCFEINLLDELSFFSPTGKIGEIFEIPVSAQNCVQQLLPFVSPQQQ
jgi:leucyl aminopeptidase